MREYTRKKPKALDTPAAVACLVTSSCNLTCPHCFARAYEKKDPHDLPFESWRTIMKNLSDAGVYAVIITGGEPLLRDDLEKIITEAVDCNLTVSLITNGAKLTEERLKSLVATGIPHVMISLDSSTAEGHDTFRGFDGLFARIQKAVPFLRENNVGVTLIAALTRNNIKESGEIVKTAHALGSTRIRLKNLCMAGRAVTHGTLEPEPHEYIQAVRDIYEADHTLPDMYVRYPDLPAVYYEKGIGITSYYSLITQGKIGECGAGFIGAAVSPQGNLQLCDMIQEPLGSVLHDDLTSLWNSEALEMIRAIDVRALNPCNDCRLKDVCLAGCKGLPSQYNEHNTLMSDLLCRKCLDSFPELFKGTAQFHGGVNP